MLPDSHDKLIKEPLGQVDSATEQPAAERQELEVWKEAAVNCTNERQRLYGKVRDQTFLIAEMRTVLLRACEHAAVKVPLAPWFEDAERALDAHAKFTAGEQAGPATSAGENPAPGRPDPPPGAGGGAG
jgi:hypothetical protein